MLDLHRYTVNSNKRIVNNPSSRSKSHWCKSNKHYCNSAMSKYLKKYDLKRHSIYTSNKVCRKVIIINTMTGI